MKPERFIFFNDDMFVLRPMPETAFFRDGLPCTLGAEVPAAFCGEAGIWQHLIVNDLRVVNNHFSKAAQVRANKKTYISREYPWKDNLRTRILERLYPELFLGFKNLHAPAAFTKGAMEELWQAEPALLDATSSHRFRTNEDVNQWLILWWQIAGGRFSPFATDNVVMGCTSGNVDRLCGIIKKQTHDMLCINDPSGDVPIDELSARLRAAFETILPEKSRFEK